MKRSHRLLRDAHRRRMERWPQARLPGGHDAAAGSAGMQEVVLGLHGDGLLSVDVSHAGMTSMHGEVSGALSSELGGNGLSGALGRSMASSVFTGRARACAVQGEALVLERVLRALDEVMRRRALVDHRAEPAWPPGYLDRRAREAAEARAGAREIGGLLGNFASGGELAEKERAGSGFDGPGDKAEEPWKV